MLTKVLISLVYICFSLLMFCVDRDNSNSKLKDKQYKEKTSPKSYKTEIKILSNPELAYSGFEQPGPGD